MMKRNICVRLIDEQYEMWRPVGARQLQNSIYIIIDENKLSDYEEWEYNIGQIVLVKYIIHNKRRFLAAIGLQKYYFIDSDGDLRWNYEDKINI